MSVDAAALSGDWSYPTRIRFGPGRIAELPLALAELAAKRLLRLSWTREEVDGRLDAIMVNIHKQAYETAEKYGMPGNYVAGANIAGFLKIAEAMTAQGMV